MYIFFLPCRFDTISPFRETYILISIKSIINHGVYYGVYLVCPFWLTWIHYIPHGPLLLVSQWQCINSFIFYFKYKKRLLLRCIHHFKSDLINNMDHMRISGTEPSSVILSQTK